MAYFMDHSNRIRLLPPGAGGGLRRGQLGAIHAVGKHFSLRSDPALIVMPTGAGKTAVLMLTPFLQGARRALVVTPSRLVRNQIAVGFRSLAVLCDAGALAGNFPGPTVREIEGRIVAPDDWRALEDCDVVVGTPLSVSPALAGIPAPPPGLFDLVLVDEAHHSPAKTWNALLESFPGARRALFTATPFRRDRREIRGDIAFNYPIREAFADRIFGDLNYLPVVADAVAGNDVAIARAAGEVFARDRAAGFDHYIMVRTDSRVRADELAGVYREHTQLRLRLVHSGHSYRHIRQTIDLLRAGQLDGIICVNMLGEGFDFPNLKIAAVHAPHKSLAVTLQFIGRFTRTGAPDVGPATFLAVPSDISIAAERLYEEDAIWQEIVPGLLETHIDREVRTRESLQTFAPLRPAEEGPDQADVSLYALRPYHHVKVYEVTGQVRLDVDVQPPAPATVIHRWVSEESATTIFITRTQSTPRWTSLDVFTQTTHDLFIVHHHVATGLLFICASRRSDALYDHIVEQFCPEGAHRLPLNVINKALSGLTNIEVFNLGLRNRVRNSTTESYRTLMGGGAQKAVKRGDAQLYHQGHSFGRATDGEKEVTIGLSSASKIWSNTSSRLPELLEWCALLAERLTGAGVVRTNSELDYLRAGEVVAAIPDGVIAATWSAATFAHPPAVIYPRDGGGQTTRQLLDLDLAVDPAASDTGCIRLTLRGPDLDWPLTFSLARRRYFSPAAVGQPAVMIERGGNRVLIEDYLSAYTPTFYFADFSALIGREWFHAPPEEPSPFDPGRIDAVDWGMARVDIQTEYGGSPTGRRSIHSYLEERLVAAGYEIVFYDHGSGELADFLAVRSGAAGICFELFHCKGAGGPRPGARVADLYEVCGQAIKSVRWVHNPRLLVQRVRERIRGAGSRFIHGDIAALEQLAAAARGGPSSYRIVVVQPGVSRARLTGQLSRLLAAADDHLRQAGCEDLAILGSL